MKNESTQFNTTLFNVIIECTANQLCKSGIFENISIVPGASNEVELEW